MVDSGCSFLQWPRLLDLKSNKNKFQNFDSIIVIRQWNIGVNPLRKPGHRWGSRFFGTPGGVGGVGPGP